MDDSKVLSFCLNLASYPQLLEFALGSLISSGLGLPTQMINARFRRSFRFTSFSARYGNRVCKRQQQSPFGVVDTIALYVRLNCLLKRQL